MFGNFEYIKPETLAEALRYLDTDGSIILAGGTDVVPNIRIEKIKPSLLVDIKGIAELKGIEQREEGLWIGALTTIQELTNAPLLSPYRAIVEGARALGCLEIRCRATLGGNICNGSPSADSVPGLLLYDAKVIIASRMGDRSVSLEDFLLDVGKVDLKAGEMLKGIILPAPVPSSTSRYYRRSRVKGMDLASVSVAVYAQDLGFPGKSCVKIALGAVKPTVARMRKAEELLRGKDLKDNILDEAIDLILNDISPRRGSLRAHPEYKKKMIAVLIKQAISEMSGGVCDEA